MRVTKKGVRIHFEQTGFLEDLSVERLKRVRCLCAHLGDLGFDADLESELPKTLGSCLVFDPYESED
ncbi:MAG: hypothetical protein JW774_07510 [Candidatus Aureabacteria bacterium]|nr:hypothetical protein [Candidatus Auribacterota bacterium]